MTRLVTYVILAACVLGVGAAGQQQPVFRGTGDAVRVFVTVTDGDGRLVTTLTQDDFEVRDEGKPQPITLFDNTPQPIRLIVMLDVSGSMEGNLPLLRAAPNNSSRGSARTTSRASARSATRSSSVRHSRAIPTSFVAALPAHDCAPMRRRRSGARSTRRWTRSATDERVAVVLVLSDGKDSGPTGFRQPFVSQAEVIDRARRRGRDDLRRSACAAGACGRCRRESGRVACRRC